MGQKIREVLLRVSKETIAPLTELSLMFAARAQHIAQVILPALERGELVLCDRFTDSSIAYQGFGRGVPLETIRTLDERLCHGVRPDLTLFLDIDVATSMARTRSRNQAADESGSRFEQEGKQFFERVREGYLAIARQEPQRVHMVDGSGTLEQIQAAVRSEVEEFLRGAVREGGPAAGGSGGI